MLERGVVAGDAVELLGALVRGNGDERATGAGGVVRELTGQAAQAREAGTADALGEGREEEDRVCVATHDLRDCVRVTRRSMPRIHGRPRLPRRDACRDGDASRALLQRAATSPNLALAGIYVPRTGAENGRSPSASSRCAREVPRRPPRFRRGGRGDLDEVGGSHGRPELRRTEGLATTQRPRHITLQAALITHRLESGSEPEGDYNVEAMPFIAPQPTGDCDDEMMPSALLSFR